jgi:hypothetical protein
MGFQAELDLSEQQSMEQVENMDRVPVGWYRAQCVDHYEDAKAEDGGQYVLEFDIQGGLYAGKKLFYRFKDPAIVDDEKGKKTARSRVSMLAARFGLITQDQLGKPGVPIDFDKSIGREVVLQVTEQKTQNGGTFIGLAYAGIYPLDHEKIPDNVRKDLNLPASRAKTAAPGASGAAGGTAAPGANRVGTPTHKKDDFADII